MYIQYIYPFIIFGISSHIDSVILLKNSGKMQAIKLDYTKRNLLEQKKS